MYIVLLVGCSVVIVWGLWVGVCWWWFGVGVLLGLVCVIKWFGVYFVLFFGVMVLVFDVVV